MQRHPEPIYVRAQKWIGRVSSGYDWGNIERKPARQAFCNGLKGLGRR